MNVVTPHRQLLLDSHHEFDNRVVLTTPEGVELSSIIAGLGSRLAARLLDWFIRSSVLFGLFTGLAGIGPIGSGVGIALVIITTFLLVLGYDVFFEMINDGRTPGKMAVGIRVVRMGGQRITFWASMVRNLLRVIDELASFGLVGIISVLVTTKEQRLGDLAGGTIVVRDRLYTAPEVLLPSWIHDPAAPFLAWDTSGISADEITITRQFIERRETLNRDARAALAAQLASQIRPQVPNAPGWSDEQFLIAVVASRLKRASLR